MWCENEHQIRHRFRQTRDGMLQRIATFLSTVIENIVTIFIQDTDVRVESVAIRMSKRFRHERQGKTLYDLMRNN